MILQYFKTHWFYKIFKFIFVVFSSLYLFNFLKFSRFLKISFANFESEKKARIKKTIIENNNYINDLIKKQAEFLKNAAE
jgi:hypothetical protein